MARRAWAMVAGVAALALGTTGCLFINSRGDTRGEITFGWGFADAASCGGAGVDEMAITLRTKDSASTSRWGPTNEDCNLGGFRLTDVAEGNYTLTLEALQIAGDTAYVMYSGSVDLVVVGGSETDLGTLVLGRSSGGGGLGELTANWEFEIPGTDHQTTLSCPSAGVKNVRFALSGPSPFNDVYDCQSGPGTIQNLAPGSYTLTLTGEGEDGDGNAVALYQEANIAVTVADGQTTQVGLRTLTPIAGNFSTLSVGWSFAGGESCTSTGVSQVHVQIFRGAASSAEDDFTWGCSNIPAVRNWFLPGDYRTLVSAVGNQGGTTINWRGETQRRVGPGDTEQYDVSLQRQP